MGSYSQMNMHPLIPVYNADGSLFAWASEQRFEQLQSAGLVARVVRRRKGRICRAILFLRPGEPKPMLASSVTGTRYSFRELLTHGSAWELKHLAGGRDGKTYAPPDVRTAFFEVMTDCTAPETPAMPAALSGRPLRPSANLVDKANLPRPGATCAKCPRTDG
jgi:hypothetical protein